MHALIHPVLLTQLAFVHTSQDAIGTPGALGWTLDPWVTLPLALSLAWYLIGRYKLARRSRSSLAMSLPHSPISSFRKLESSFSSLSASVAPTSSFPRRRESSSFFLLGWTALALALVTPLHDAGERSFAAHMLEHELLMLVAAPLVVLSRPIGVALWALPQRARLALSRTGHSASLAWNFLTAPIVATLLQAAALWLWHAPRLFDVALANPGWHIVQHLCFLVTALLFWWSVLIGRGRTHAGLAIGCLFFTATVSGALGALMALSNSPWYAGYARSGHNAFGLMPAEDQQLAGLLMWVPGGLVHAGAALALLAARLKPREVAAASRSTDATRTAKTNSIC